MVSHPFRRPSARKNTRGLTLSEAAIFLGVAGLVFGAIWGAASSVIFNRQIGNTLGDIMQITQNVRSLYSRQSTFSGLSGWTTGSNITEAMVNAEVVPTEMIDSGDLTTLRSPWKTPVRIQIGSLLTTFEIVFENTLPSQACVALTARAIGAGRDKGLIEVNVGGTSYTGNALGNLTTTTIPNNCTNVTFIFNLKG
ncbi:MAG: type 4 pilus major pilin [Alphaproteobacteria bacterium]|nr:type 4 pilus major pilin [Alphaproteobacteria bacterium]